MKNEILITFIDNTNVYYKNPLISGVWNKIPKKTIKEIKYLFGKYILIASGYSEYNHVVHYVLPIGKQVGYISHSSILLSYKKHTIEIMFGMDGNIVKKTHKKNKEFRGKSYTGWKHGIANEPNFKIYKDPS